MMKTIAAAKFAPCKNKDSKSSQRNPMGTILGPNQNHFKLTVISYLVCRERMGDSPEYAKDLCSERNSDEPS